MTNLLKEFATQRISIPRACKRFCSEECDGVFQIILHIYQSRTMVGTLSKWLTFYITTHVISHEPVYEKLISLHFGGVGLTNKEDVLLISNFVKYVTELDVGGKQTPICSRIKTVMEIQIIFLLASSCALAMGVTSRVFLI